MTCMEQALRSTHLATQIKALILADLVVEYELVGDISYHFLRKLASSDFVDTLLTAVLRIDGAPQLSHKIIRSIEIWAGAEQALQHGRGFGYLNHVHRYLRRRKWRFPQQIFDIILPSHNRKFHWSCLAMVLDSDDSSKPAMHTIDNVFDHAHRQPPVLRLEKINKRMKGVEFSPSETLRSFNDRQWSSRTYLPWQGVMLATDAHLDGDAWMAHLGFQHGSSGPVVRYHEKSLYHDVFACSSYFHIYIKIWGTNNIRLFYPDHAPISALKTKIEYVVGIPKFKQDLFWGHHKLRDDESLSESGVEKGYSLDLCHPTVNFRPRDHPRMEIPLDDIGLFEVKTHFYRLWGIQMPFRIGCEGKLLSDNSSLIEQKVTPGSTLYDFDLPPSSISDFDWPQPWWTSFSRIWNSEPDWPQHWGVS